MHIKTNRIALLGLLIACFLVSFQVNVSNTSAYTASITTNDSIELDITPNGNGTSIHSESINVQSDCRAGYNLTIATPEGSDLYKYENNTQSSNTASFTAVDGTSALSSDNNTNKWGYTLTSDPNGNTVFSPLSTTASILKTPSQTASPEADINDTFSINYGAKVDNTVEAGTYQMANNGAIVYYLTMDTTCTQYTVSFNPNGGTGTMENQPIQTGESTKLTSSESLTAPTGGSYIDADNNTITGDPDKLWTFWGWNTSADGTGDWYKDKEAVTDLANVGSTITLYAQWKQAALADMIPGTPIATEKVIDHNLMQDMKPEVCYNSIAYSTDTSSDAHNPYDASTNPNGYHTITLLDYRGKVTTGENPESPESYTVSKLPDNLCWMTKDLNLGRESGGENNNGTVTLTPDDTDITANFTLPASPTTYTTGSTGYRTPQILINHTVTSYTVNGVSYSPTIGHYSWAAATATRTSITASGEVATSICPKNWDLPNRIQFYNLRSKGSVTSAAIAHAAPYNFVYGGYRNAASGYSGETSYGYYWTSSNSNSSNGYWNYIYSGGIYNGSTSSGYKSYGAKVRCVASLGKVTINYDGNTNDGGSTANQENVEIATSKVVGNGYTKDGYWFSEWNTEPDGSGISISVDAPVSSINPAPGSTITLYAQWLPQYTITYVNNCQTYASANSSCTQAVSERTGEQTIELDANGDGSTTLGAYNYSSWSLSGWKIKGWSTVPDNSNNTNPEYRINSTYDVSNQGADSGITLYAHWVPLYSIQYDGNNADNPNGMGTTDSSTGVKSVKQTNVGEGDPVTLLASNFKKARNGFVGWSTDSDAWAHFTDNDATNDPIIYGPMETIDAPSYPTNGTNIITMYAVWVPAETSGGNPVYLQEWDSCSSLTSTVFDSTTGRITATKNGIIALTDKRDDEVYTVAKLADDHCWMVENLRLEHAGTVGNNKNDSSTTNEFLSQGYGGTAGTYGNFVGLANPEFTNFQNSYTSNGVTVANTIYKSDGSGSIYDSNNNSLEDIGTSNYPGYRFPRYNNSNTHDLIDSPTYTQNYMDASNPSDNPSYNFYSNQNLYSYGNYYTWAAAIASTHYYSSWSTSEFAYTSVCPSGWHIPSSRDATKEYGNLAQHYGGSGSSQNSTNDGANMNNRFRAFPNNFVNSGEYYDSSARVRGSNGYYWGRSAYLYSYSYHLVLFDKALDPSNSSDKGHGLSVRCMADYTYTIQYDGNGADNPNGMGVIGTRGKKGVRQTEVIEGKKINLLASNFKRVGYGFVGWSTDPDAWTHFIDNDNTNDPVIYGPMETITAPSRPTYSGGILTMYAVWVPAEKDGSNNPVYLQEWNSCSSLTSTSFNGAAGKIIATKNSIVALTDKRDNEVYAIAKLADDKCWMIENLRLEHTSTVGNNINDNSVTNQSLSQGYGGTTGTYGNFVGLAAPESLFYANSVFSNTIYESSTNPPVNTYDPINDVLEDIGTANSPSRRFPRYNSDNTQSSIDSPTYIQNYYDESNPSNSPYSDYYSTQNLYSYGNYYTWAASMANTNHYTSSSVSESVNTSLCPSGWHLPSSGNSTKEYNVLFQSYDSGGGVNNSASRSNYFRSFPNNFLYSGQINGGARDRGSYGYYWSRSVDGDNYSYAFYLAPNSSGPALGNDYKSFGHAIRCLISGS